MLGVPGNTVFDFICQKSVCTSGLCGGCFFINFVFILSGIALLITGIEEWDAEILGIKWLVQRLK